MRGHFNKVITIIVVSAIFVLTGCSTEETLSKQNIIDNSSKTNNIDIKNFYSNREISSDAFSANELVSLEKNSNKTDSGLSELVAIGKKSILNSDEWESNESVNRYRNIIYVGICRHQDLVSYAGEGFIIWYTDYYETDAEIVYKLSDASSDDVIMIGINKETLDFFYEY